MARKWYPVINWMKCNECGACVERCVHQVYKQGTTRPLVLHPENCTSCMSCQRVCPEGAIDFEGDTVGDVGCGCSRKKA
jgi:NAD-dependent dihydropyrimidine dehydrogenase PreA subunit